MATIKYLLQSSSGNAPVYLRLSLGRSKSLKRKIGLHINPKQWSKATGFPIPKDTETKLLKNKLKDLEVYILKEYNSANTTGNVVNGNWLENRINKFFDRNQEKNLDYLINYCDHFIKILRVKSARLDVNSISVSTLKKYITIVNKLKAFQKHKKKKYLIKDVDLNFRDKLIEYFIDVDNLSENTTGRYIKFVKTIILDAEVNGHEISNQIKSFKGFTVKSPKVILTIEELEQIKNTNFDKPEYEIAKDWLIIGFYTGQRVSDLLRMNKSFIQKIYNYDFIVLEQVKTKKLVQIPLHREVQAVLEKRNGEFPPVFTDNIESNKAIFNRYLKELCKKAEINTITEGNASDPDSESNRKVLGKYEKWRLISSHICRRSFSSHFYSNPLYPTPVLMNITAHSTEQQFLEYIGKKPIDYSLQLAKIWNKENI